MKMPYQDYVLNSIVNSKDSWCVEPLSMPSPFMALAPIGERNNSKTEFELLL